MSGDIKNSKELIWNKRVENRMKELKFSQRSFIKEYRKRFGTGSQSDVSKWMRIGEKDGKSGKLRKFPSFETMSKIAEILGVSVGYLIGETDYESFDMEKVSTYLGLSSSAITSIRNITSFKEYDPLDIYPDAQITDALELILTSSLLEEYLRSVCMLAKSIFHEKNPKSDFEEELKKIPDYMREDVLAVFDSSWRHDENPKISNVTDDIIKCAESLHNSAYEEAIQYEELKKQTNASKYAVNENHIKLIDEIMNSGDMKRMLPRDEK